MVLESESFKIVPSTNILTHYQQQMEGMCHLNASNEGKSISCLLPKYMPTVWVNHLELNVQ